MLGNVGETMGNLFSDKLKSTCSDLMVNPRIQVLCMAQAKASHDGPNSTKVGLAGHPKPLRDSSDGLSWFV